MDTLTEDFVREEEQTETVGGNETEVGEAADVNDSAPKKKRKRKKSRFFKPIMVLIVVCFCLYAVAEIISQQAQIEQIEQETEAMTEKVSELKHQRDEYTEMLNADEAEFMLKVAVEQLGYAYPNERRFYIINGSDN